MKRLIDAGFLALVVLTVVMCNSQLFGQGIQLDFNTNPADRGIVFTGSAEWRPVGGFDNTGYLKLTDAVNGQRGAIIFPDLADGEALAAFRITADLRVGGGMGGNVARPADGFSFNLVRPDDPLLEDPLGEGYANSPSGEQNLPEEGSTTGLAIGFDEWLSDGGDPDATADDCGSVAFDCIGMSVRIDNALVAQFPFSLKNGRVDDLTSLQTGPGAAPAEQLGWAPLVIELSEERKLFISYKGVEVFNDTIEYEPGPGLLVFGGRTGGANSNHHIDNITILNLLSDFLSGDFNSDGVIDLADFSVLVSNMQTERAFVTDGDIDFNGRVDLRDFIAFRRAFADFQANPPVAAAAVPEPYSCLLSISGLLGLCLMRGVARRTSRATTPHDGQVS